MRSCFVAISAKFIHSCLGMQWMASLAEPIDEVLYVELSVNQTARELLRQIPQAERYFFSAFVWNRNMCLHLMQDLRKLYAGCEIYVGGPEGRARPEEYLQHADGIIIGEGESVLLDLLQGRDNKHIYRGGLLPVPNRESSLNHPYPFAYIEPNKIVYYETQRGCPYKCSYCMSATEQGLVYAPMEKVKAELLRFIEMEVPLVKLVDRTFNSNEAHALEILEFIRVHGKKTRFHLELAPYLITERLLEALRKAAPYIQVEIGFQALQSEVLRSIDRPAYSPQTLHHFEKLMKLPLHRHVDLIAGLPKMGMKEIKETFNYLYDQAPDELQLGFLKLMPATPLFEMRQFYGLVASSEPPYEILSTPWLSFQELNHLKGVEEIAQLINQKDFAFTMHYLREKQTAFELYDALARSLPQEQTTLENRLHQVEAVLADPMLKHYLELDYHRKKRHRKHLFLQAEPLAITEMLTEPLLGRILRCLPDLDTTRLQQRIAVYRSAVLAPFVLYDYLHGETYLLEE